MLDFLFSEAVMAKIGVVLVAALVAIAFGKILLSMSGRFLRFWLENNGNLCELKSSENIGAAVSDVTGACCMADITSLGFRWCCNESCNCGGEHEHYLNGLVSWEGYTAYLGSSVYCTCMAGDAVETDGGAKISVSFKNDVIIFENSYTNAPNDVVPLRSTVNTLRVSAYGGEYGGVLEIDVDDGNRLVWCDGDILMSPIEIAAGGREELRIDYTACTNSETINDIVVSVRFSEHFSGVVINDTATMTAVRVRLSAQVEAPECDLRDRHKFGIYEKVGCRQYPSSPQLSWVPIDGTITSDESIFYDCFYQCPIHKAERSLKVGKDSVFYLFDINVVEPSLVISRNVEAISYGLSENSAGGIGMTSDLYIGPMDVSFSNIFVEEVPSTKGTRSGYFNSSYFQGAWYHSVANGAGRWLYVDVSNKSGSDVAAWTNRLLRMNDAGLLVEDTQYSWRNGHIEWEVPYGWHTNSLEESYAPYKRFAEDVRQRFQITTDGTVAVEKFGNIVMRMTNDWQFLNGVRVK